MSTRSERLCVWSGVGTMVLFFGGVIAAGFVPPPSPHDSAAELAAFYESHTTGIRWGMMGSMWGAALLVPWSAALSQQIKRIDGRYSPLAYSQLALGALTVAVTIQPLFQFQVLVFRDRPLDDVQTMSDNGWLLWVGIAYFTALQMVIAAIVILSRENRRQRIFPIWVGRLSIVTAAITALDHFVMFTDDGAFAWNGFMAYWVALGAGGVWVIAMTAGLFHAISVPRQDEALAAVPARG